MPKVKEGEIIDLRQKVVVYATDKHRYADAGDELSVQPKLADYLINKGWVTKEKPKATKAKE